MNKKNNGGLAAFLFLVIAGFLAVQLSSCGKTGNSNATALNIRYKVINLSPNLGPISLYVDYKIYNNYNFYYPGQSGYFYLTSIDTPFQIRASPNQTPGTVIIPGNILNIDAVLKANLRYSLFVTGLRADTITGVFLTDTSAVPKIGRGKVRFLNASPRSTGFDIYANDKEAFHNQLYTKVSPFVELPAGMYNFQIYQTGTKTSVIGSLNNFTVQDGRLYTLYSYGLAGHTDSLAFGTGAVVNN